MTQEHASGASHTSMKVLLVDDEDVLRTLTAHALREQGFEVQECSSGDQALQTLPYWAPDVVVLDAMMPGRDGFSTCASLRMLPGFETLPVLMLTGLNDNASIAHAYEVGATDFFVKSDQWTLLGGRLRYLMRSATLLRELERNKARLARAQDLARIGSFEWRRGQWHVVFSVEALRVFSMNPSSGLSFRRAIRMLSATERAQAMALLHDTLSHATVLNVDLTFHLSRTTQRVFHIEAEPEFNELGQLVGYSGILQDVTERRLAEDRIRQLANFDGLTSLPNRRHMLWRAERALEQARRQQHKAALLLVDLDRFKIINDTLGHTSGDELLVEVSRRLRTCLRHSDRVIELPVESAGSRSHRTLEAIGRLGGDEFVALLPEVHSEQDADIVAQRILKQMREPIVLSGHECFVTASIGIALYPADGQNVADLMRHADMAMYSVKGSGRNNAQYYRPSLAGHNRARFELEAALHKALERQELVLHYQPKIDVITRRMVGAEALMRWNRGGRLVPPIEFIPLAEETGLITPMSEWAIKEAARQAKVWQDQFEFSESIAVNIPSQLFERADLVDFINNATMTQGISHRNIQLEITETGLMKDLQQVIPALHRLNGLGVEISIDDFGTGYSSLAYLTTLPISELKIDASFVRNLVATPQSSAIVTAIVALARSLGIRAVAEGVETIRQMQLLARLGCRVMQGYLFSRPQAPQDIEKWFRTVMQSDSAPWMSAVGYQETPTQDAEGAPGQNPVPSGFGGFGI